MWLMLVFQFVVLEHGQLNYVIPSLDYTWDEKKMILLVLLHNFFLSFYPLFKHDINCQKRAQSLVENIHPACFFSEIRVRKAC